MKNNSCHDFGILPKQKKNVFKWSAGPRATTQGLIVRVEEILNRRPIAIDKNGHSVCPMDIVSPGNKETQGFPSKASTLSQVSTAKYVKQRRGFQKGGTSFTYRRCQPIGIVEFKAGWI
ncbi:hypothetical protein T11_13941 [Trichinella zimbabwensis]|uniref:Uncharacterized protein n=1 Tax=Trichinella zimbabwensis TaxID=268475 RepID=A0A0V1GY90_9BILA|nr:hypothetical protein T11_13941 [Trichinella zimbabwensis]